MRTQSARACWCWRESGTRFLSRNMLSRSPQELVRASPVTEGSASVCIRKLYGGSDGQPIGAHPLSPFLDQHSIGLEETANTVPFPARDFFKNRRQHRQSAGAEHGAFRDLRYVGRLRDGNGKSIA